MATVQSFKAGDAVTHPTLGDGTVTLVRDGNVHVEFARGHILGIYDKLWFDACPHHLRHRAVASCRS